MDIGQTKIVSRVGKPSQNPYESTDGASAVRAFQSLSNFNPFTYATKYSLSILRIILPNLSL